MPALFACSSRPAKQPAKLVVWADAICMLVAAIVAVVKALRKKRVDIRIQRP